MKKDKKLYIYNLDYDLLNFKIEPTTLILLSCIISLCKNNKKYKRTIDYSCYLDKKYLSELTGLPLRTLKTGLKTLEDKGSDFLYIERRETTGDKTADFIVLNNYQLPLSKDKFKGFYVPLAVLNKKDLSYSEKLLLGYILSYGLKDKNFFVQNDSIKKILNIKTNKAIASALKKFKALGLIDVTYGKSKNSNLPIKRDIRLNKDKYTNYIEKVEINITNNNITNNNIIGNTYNDNRVINYYISLTKDEYEEFLKNRNIDNILEKDES